MSHEEILEMYCTTNKMILIVISSRKGRIINCACVTNEVGKTEKHDKSPGI